MYRPVAVLVNSRKRESSGDGTRRWRQGRRWRGRKRAGTERTAVPALSVHRLCIGTFGGNRPVCRVRTFYAAVASRFMPSMTVFISCDWRASSVTATDDWRMASEVSAEMRLMSSME